MSDFCHFRIWPVLSRGGKKSKTKLDLLSHIYYFPHCASVKSDAFQAYDYKC